MPFLHKPNRLFVLLICCGFIQLTTTNAFRSTLQLNTVVHRINFAGKDGRDSHRGKGGNSFEKSGLRYNYNYDTTKLPAATTEDDNEGQQKQGTLIGTLVLLTVPLSWGTYVPVGKYIFD